MAVAWTGASQTGVGEAGEELHERIANGLLVLIGLYLAGVVMVSILSKENLVTAMITGCKARERYPDAVPAAGIAVPAAALVIAAGVYCALQIDAWAFTPNANADASETRGDGADRD